MSSFSRLDYHFVFVTKYRRPVLAGIEADVKRAFRAAARGGKFEIIELAVDLGDHVHLVVRASTETSPAMVARRLKQLTTLDLWSRHEPWLRRSYWKKKKVLWSSGYFVSTVGAVSKTTVLEYVKKQKH